MAREAALFRVQGPSGVYYAVYEPERQLLFTEANEKGARDHAAERGLTLMPERQIQHADLMRLTGRDAPARQRPAAKPAVVQAPPDSVIEPLEVRLPANVKQSTDDVIRTQGPSVGNLFASSTPLSETPAKSDDGGKSGPMDARPSDAINRDVLNFIQSPRTGRSGNPFSDRSQK
jgi:hypothetical protein